MGKTYEITYMDTQYRRHTTTSDNITAFYQRVRREGLIVVKPPKIIKG